MCRFKFLLKFLYAVSKLCDCTLAAYNEKLCIRSAPKDPVNDLYLISLN